MAEPEFVGYDRSDPNPTKWKSIYKEVPPKGPVVSLPNAVCLCSEEVPWLKGHHVVSLGVTLCEEHGRTYIDMVNAHYREEQAFLQALKEEGRKREQA